MFMDAAARRALEGMHALGRLGEPSEVAELVLDEILFDRVDWIAVVGREARLYMSIPSNRIFDWKVSN
jgi:hypothetical protein